MGGVSGHHLIRSLLPLLHSLQVLDDYRRGSSHCDSDHWCRRKHDTEHVVCLHGVCHCAAWYSESRDHDALVCHPLLTSFILMVIGAIALLIIVVLVLLYLHDCCCTRNEDEEQEGQLVQENITS